MSRSGHVWTPDRTTDAEARIRDAARAVGLPGAFTSGRLAVRIDFTAADRRRCDLDNMAKLVLDSLNPSKRLGWPGVWSDDSQIDRLLVTRRLDRDAPGTHVTISEVES